MRVAVAFEQKDVSTFKDVLEPDDILLGNVECHIGAVKHIRPQLHRGTELILAETVKKEFLKFEAETGANSISGFANNFYECAVAPLCEYLTSLDALLMDLNKSQTFIEVWFPANYLFATKYSAYYMAEHESQGKQFYSRENVFTPYLVELCKRHKMTIRFAEFRFAPVSFVHRLLRVSSVLVWRFIKGVLPLLRRTEVQVVTEEPSDLIAVTRSLGQTEFLLPFLKASGLITMVMGGETFVGAGRNQAAVQAAAAEEPGIIGRKICLSAVDLICNYGRALWLMLTKPRICMNVSGVDLDLDQAMTEVLVMWPDLLSYRNALHKLLRQAAAPTGRILLSTEQKSPYAQADAWVAKRQGLLCVQVMQCDQHARPLPFPVFGDFFLADSAINATLFQEAWPNDRQKVLYLGSFKACAGKRDAEVDLFTVERRWCFFSQVDDVDKNKKILSALRTIRKNTPCHIVVKLHPRDSVANYKSFDDFIFLSDGMKSKNELFDSFDLALSFPSGVVLDLIFQNKPFIILKVGRWSDGNYSYIDHSYPGIISNIDQLSSLMSAPQSLSVAFKAYRQRFLEKSGIISDVDIIRKALLELPLE